MRASDLKGFGPVGSNGPKEAGLIPPPPAEQASGELLRSLADRWEKRAAECEKDAERLGMQPVANELARDAAQYRQCAYQLRGAIAPQQPEKGATP